MTLYIKLVSATNLPFMQQHQEGNIYVEGSQAGTLVAEYKDKNHDWGYGFEINCSKNDKLSFKVCTGISLKSQVIIGVAELNCPSFVKKHETKLNMHTPYEVQIRFEAKVEKLGGKLKLRMLYDKFQLYMGQMNGITKTEKIESIPPKAIYFKKKSEKITKVTHMMEDDRGEEENSSKIIKSILRDE